jgi:hypothetical protein
MTSDSTLGLQPDLAIPARSAVCRHTCCGWAQEGPCDCHQQAAGRYACTSRSGRKRKHHEYLHESPAGLRCVFCDSLSRMVAL